MKKNFSLFGFLYIEQQNIYVGYRSGEQKKHAADKKTQKKKP